jgi:hypothetical protein
MVVCAFPLQYLSEIMPMIAADLEPICIHSVLEVFIHGPLKPNPPRCSNIIGID